MTTTTPEPRAGHFDNDEARDLRPDDLDPDRRPWGSRATAMLCSIVILGVAIGVCGGLLTLMLYAIEHAMLGFVESPELPGPFLTHPWRRVGSVLAGVVVAAVAWWLLRTRTTAVPSVRKAVQGALMPVWQTVAHVLLQIMIVGCGLSMGREVAPRELGSMLAQRVCALTGVHRKDLKAVVAMAAGAGLAAVYNAPLAGGFFAVEILLVDVTAPVVALSFLCSALAAWVATLVKGTHTFYVIGQVDAVFMPDTMGFALVMGLMAGVVGALFRRGSAWAESYKATGASILWQLPLAGAVTGIVAIWVPQVMGNGRATAQMGFSGKAEWGYIWLLLLSLVAKALVTLMTIRAGASGGVLTPGIAIGSSLGCILGIAWVHWCGSAAGSMGLYALIGACALLSASQNAPLMAMTLVMELTEAPSNLYVPVALACMVAAMAGRWTTGRMERGIKARASRL
ncbi:MAG: chloride channel protein [Bifidobacterium sp.]|nr:chloride channel protein [Bifidobacterium sp.]